MSSSAQFQQWASNDPNAPPNQSLSRKAQAIKRYDAEQLTREDVQYDLLHFIFSDPLPVFSRQTQAALDAPPKVHFCDLYVDALYKSPKCSKVLKDKMVETPEFAVELGKISLLTNVGRINTTMAFFPEMKTALRTYHPIPSLQKTDGNAQDAPRIKNCLKASLLPEESKGIPPATLEEIRARAAAGHIPPTSVVNLIFVLTAHAAGTAAEHFDPPVNFLDLFLPVNLSSASRARAFLWLIYHYLEDPKSPNPFDDDYSSANPGKVPRLARLSEEEAARENLDTVQEMLRARELGAIRRDFLETLVVRDGEDRRPKTIGQYPPPARPSPEHYGHAPARPRRPQSHDQNSMHYYYNNPAERPPPPDRQMPLPMWPPLPVRQPSPIYLPPPRIEMKGPPGSRTMVEHAAHVISNIDALCDSDEEFADDHVRLDYERRLDVLARIRRKSATPPGSDFPMSRWVMDPTTGLWLEIPRTGWTSPGGTTPMTLSNENLALKSHRELFSRDFKD